MQLVEFGFANVPNVKGDMKLRANLGAGAFGDDQELVKFSSRTSVETLSNVRHDRNSCTLNLVTKTEIPSESTLPSHPVNVRSQLPRLLPSNQVLKSPYAHNASVTHSTRDCHNSARNPVLSYEDSVLSDSNGNASQPVVLSTQHSRLSTELSVAERPGDDGDPRYVLVCGEGRLNAFRILGETHIPALVVDVTDEDAFIMSLAENIARRGYRPLEILADIEVLRKRGYSAEIIIQKTGLSPKYVKDIVFLLDQGEERLIEGVQRGTIPLTTALEIARANENASTTGADGHSNLGDLLQEAYRI